MRCFVIICLKGYFTVLINVFVVFFSEGCYDYAIPEAGTIPLLSPEHTLARPHINSVGSDISRATSKSLKTDGKKVNIFCFKIKIYGAFF